MKFSVVLAAFIAAATAIPVSVIYDDEVDLVRRQDDAPAPEPSPDDIVSGPDASTPTMTDANGNIVAFNSANVFVNSTGDN